MSVTAASALIIPPISEPWYAKPFRFATLPKAAEKVWACIKYESFRRRSSTITITDSMGAQWCSASLGVHVGRRCFQKGLKQLEDIGAIVRHRGRGQRQITITVNLAGPKPKAKAKATARKGKPTPAATAATQPTPAPTALAEPPASPEECRQAAAVLRAFVAQLQAAEPAGQPEGAATRPRGASPRRPRLAIPEVVRREIEEKERRRIADELARLRDIPDDLRTDDQERQLKGLAAELGEPGSPPAPSGP